MINNFKDFRFLFKERYGNNKKSEYKLYQLEAFISEEIFSFNLDKIYYKICELDYEIGGPQINIIYNIFKKNKIFPENICPKCKGEKGELINKKKSGVDYQFFQDCSFCFGVGKIFKNKNTGENKNYKLDFANESQ